eukprot:scaffold198682_cov14-Tisochrysis_lutea.AAC.1
MDRRSSASWSSTLLPSPLVPAPPPPPTKPAPPARPLASWVGLIEPMDPEEGMDNRQLELLACRVRLGVSLQVTC